MPVANFHEELTIESVTSLIERLEAVESTEFCDLYFSSVGGTACSMEMLLDYLAKHNHWTLICVAEFSSCAFITFCRYKGNKYFTTQSNALIHLLGYSEHTRERMNDNENHKRATANLKKDNDILISMLEKLELPSDLVTKVKKGKDIVLYYEDLIKLKWGALLE